MVAAGILEDGADSTLEFNFDLEPVRKVNLLIQVITALPESLDITFTKQNIKDLFPDVFSPEFVDDLLSDVPDTIDYNGSGMKLYLNDSRSYGSNRSRDSLDC